MVNIELIRDNIEQIFGDTADDVVKTIVQITEYFNNLDIIPEGRANCRQVRQYGTNMQEIAIEMVEKIELKGWNNLMEESLD